jgi:fatty-acyl-CoA synthase
LELAIGAREGWTQVGTWLERWAEREPERIALRDGARRLSYAVLAERCARAAGALRELGVQRGDRFALLLGNGSPALELAFAAARLGAIAVPLNTRLTPHELRDLIADAEPRLVVHDVEWAGLAEAAMPALPRLALGASPDAYEAALASACPLAPVPSSGEDAMLLIYTSGTTGRPKGALLPQRKTLYNSSNAERYFQITPADCVGIPLPLYHSFALSILALPAFFAGATCALQRRFDAASLWRYAADAGFSYFGAVPTQLRMLLEARSALSAQMADDLRSLRFVFSAGAALPVSLIESFAQFGIVVKQGYGQTETSLLCSLDASDALRKKGSVGRPVHHAQLRVIARDTLALPVSDWRDVGVGEAGEIAVRGPITMLGYWRQPESSAETLREGWLRTGDLARVDDEGFVYLAGRSRDLYISGGENVYPAEVEALLETHPSVREVAVVGVPDERWGEVGRAFVVARDPDRFDPEALLAFAREQLAAFKLPKSICLVKALPRTDTGKVQKHRLVEVAAA